MPELTVRQRLIDDLVQQVIDGKTNSSGIVEIIKSGATQETIDKFVKWCADKTAFEPVLRLELSAEKVLATKDYFNERFLAFLSSHEGGRIDYDDLKLYFTSGFFEPAVVESSIARAIRKGDLEEARKYLAWVKLEEFTAEEIEQLIANAIGLGYINTAEEAAKLRQPAPGLTQEEFDQLVENAFNQHGSWDFDCSRLSPDKLETIISSCLDRCSYDKACSFAKWRQPVPGLTRSEWQKLVDGLPERIEEFKNYQEENWQDFEHFYYVQLLHTMVNNNASKPLIINFIQDNAKVLFSAWCNKRDLIYGEIIPNLSPLLKEVLVKNLSDASCIHTFYNIPLLVKKLYGDDVPAGIIKYLIATAIRCGDMYNAVSLVQSREDPPQLTNEELEQLKQGIVLMNEEAKQKKAVAPIYIISDSDFSWSSDECANDEEVSPWRDLGRAIGAVAFDIADTVAANVVYYFGRLSRRIK